MIIWMLLSACGTPAKTFNTTGMSSEKLPANRINLLIPALDATRNTRQLGADTKWTCVDSRSKVGRI